jgi:acyl-CoA thioesterase-2
VEQFRLVTGNAEAVEFLRAVVGVQPLDSTTARVRTEFGVVERGGLFGGQMISQALSACAHTVPEQAIPDSIHANLLAGGSGGDPVDYHVERVRDGGALQHRDVRGYQAGSLIIHATVVSAVPAGTIDWQAYPMPTTEQPRLEGGYSQRSTTGPGWGAFEVVHPDGHGPPVSSLHPLWMRSVTELPDDPWLHGAVIAFWSDYGLNGAARVTHTEVAEPVSTVSATHSIWIHRRSQARDWHLLSVETQSLSGNQGQVGGTLHDDSGRLVASMSQGVFIRRPRR